MTLGVVVLAGGQGSRIKSVLGNTPKLLAPISGRPFIHYLFDWLAYSLNATPFSVFLATGFEHEQIQHYVESHTLNCLLIREKSPLGTLGAAANAVNNIDDSINNFLIINGDTLFTCDLSSAYFQFSSVGSRSLAVVKMSNENERFGGYKILPTNKTLSITSSDPECISMGAVFASRDDVLSAFRQAEKHTNIPMMDQDFIALGKTAAFIIHQDALFIDIGVPSSYSEAQLLIPDKFH